MKDFFINLGVFCASFVLVLLILEGLLAYYYQYGEQIDTIDLTRAVNPIVQISTNEKLVYELVPNFTDHAGNKVNSYNLMSPEIPINKHPNITRIAILGDSVTMGVQEMEKSYPMKLQEILGPDYEVINAGVFGYNTVQEVALFKNKVKKYNPDIVVLGYFLNDLSRTPRVIPKTLLDRYLIKNNLTYAYDIGTNRTFQLTNPKQIKEFIKEVDTPILAIEKDTHVYLINNSISLHLLRNSYLYRFVNRRVNDILYRLNVDHKQFYYSFAKDEQFEALKELKKETDSKLFVIILPRLRNFSNYKNTEDWQKHLIVYSQLEELNITYIDLYNYYSDYDPSELKISPNDYKHHNELGAEITAQAIHKELINHGYIYAGSNKTE